MNTLTIAILLLIFPTLLLSKPLPTCVYISSYHKGFAWSDGIEDALRTTLKDQCSFIQFNMDSKRNKNEAFIQQKAKEAKELIEKINPSVVITSDDNAAKYVISKYFKNSPIPFVFCGINWTAKEYGFPYKNVTGMIEVTPIKEIFSLATSIGKGNQGIFIGDNTITDKKDLAHFVKYAKKNGISLQSALVETIEEWKDHYEKAQKDYDFILLGHNSSIKGWDDTEIQEFLAKKSQKLTLTTYSWMMPFSMIGLTIKASEQGEWSGDAAKAILGGYPVSQIAITANRTWNSWINTDLIDKTTIILPVSLIEKSQKLSSY